MIGRFPGFGALVLFALLALLAGPLRAQDEGGTPEGLAIDAREPDLRVPLASRNQMPLALLFVYLPPEGARSLAPGDWALRLRFDYSNIILDQETERERVYLDSEYLRQELDVRRGFGRGFEVAASLPFLVYYGGFLDPLVDRFHRAFGLPNFLRGQTPNGLSEIDYVRRGDVIVRRQGSFGGVGDLSLRVKKTLVDDGRVALAARGVVKLPTGRLERLTGSGVLDGGLGLAAERVGERFAIYGNVNYHFLGRPELLRTKSYLSFMVAADWRFKPRLAAVLQLDHARSPLEGEVNMFNKGSQQLALGLRWRPSERFVYEWRFVEDLASFSPDFTFGFEMGIRFPRAPADSAP